MLFIIFIFRFLILVFESISFLFESEGCRRIHLILSIISAVFRKIFKELVFECIGELVHTDMEVLWVLKFAASVGFQLFEFCIEFQCGCWLLLLRYLYWHWFFFTLFLSLGLLFFSIFLRRQEYIRLYLFLTRIDFFFLKFITRWVCALDTYWLPTVVIYLTINTIIF